MNKKVNKASDVSFVAAVREPGYTTGSTVYYDFLPNGFTAFNTSMIGPTGRYQSPLTATALSTARQSVVNQILGMIQQSVNLNFAPATEANPATIRFALAPLLLATPVTDPVTGQVTTGDGGVRSGVFVLLDSNNTDFDLGGYAYTSLIHEIGHALGLNHPDVAGGGASTTMNRLTAVMAYTDPPEHVAGQDRRYGITPLIYDLAALQGLYGVRQFEQGNTDYLFRPIQEDRDVLANNATRTIYGAQIKTIFDSGGTADTLDASAYTEADGTLDITLVDGELSTISSSRGLGQPAGLARITKNISIAFDSIIENAKGGGANDKITGNAVVNRLEGNAGNDTLDGGVIFDVQGRPISGDQQSDILIGGDGIDSYLLHQQGGMDILQDHGTNMLRYAAPDNQLASIYGLHLLRTAPGTDSWTNIAGTISATKSGTTLQVTAGIEGSSNTYQFQIPDFVEGDFNIRLTDAAAPADPAFTFSILGGVYVDGDPVAPETQRVPDGNGLGNDAVVPNTVGDDVANTLNGSAQADKIESGGGDDIIRADRVGTTSVVATVADWIQAGTGADTINSGSGADMVETGSGRGSQATWNDDGRGDIVDAGAGNDLIYGDAKIGLKDAITQGDSVTNDPPPAGLAGRGDFLNGAAGDDTIIGTSARDALFGGTGKDILIGGAGDDWLVGDSSFTAQSTTWNVSTSDAGADLLANDIAENMRAAYAGTYSQRTFSPAIDTEPAAVWGPGEADVIYGGAGNDWISANAGDDFIDAGTGADIVGGGAGSDVILGGAGIDWISGDSAVDIAGQAGDVIDGGADGDMIFGFGGDDLIFGGTGNDYIDGGSGNDIIIGGTGRDTLRGGTGRDTYYFKSGDGTETIEDPDDLDGTLDAQGINTNQNKSVIVFGEGINKADIRFSKGSLLIDLGISNPAAAAALDPNAADYAEQLDALHDRIHLTLPDGVDDPSQVQVLDHLEFADGSIMIWDDILAQGFDLDGTEGDDIIAGTKVSDRINGYGGNDILAGLAADDVLDGGAGNDTLNGSTGNDLLLGGAGVDSLAGDSGDDRLEGGDDADMLDGGDGIDTLLGDAGDDSLSGGAGADALTGGAGNDSYAIGYGMGHDTIADDAGTDVNSPELNTLSLTGGLDVNQLLVSRNGDDLVLGLRTGIAGAPVTDSATIAGFYANGSDAAAVATAAAAWQVMDGSGQITSLADLLSRAALSERGEFFANYKATILNSAAGSFGSGWFQPANSYTNYTANAINAPTWLRTHELQSLSVTQSAQGNGVQTTVSVDEFTQHGLVNAPGAGTPAVLEIPNRRAYTYSTAQVVSDDAVINSAHAPTVSLTQQWGQVIYGGRAYAQNELSNTTSYNDAYGNAITSTITSGDYWRPINALVITSGAPDNPGVHPSDVTNQAGALDIAFASYNEQRVFEEIIGGDGNNEIHAAHYTVDQQGFAPLTSSGTTVRYAALIDAGAGDDIITPSGWGSDLVLAGDGHDTVNLVQTAGLNSFASAGVVYAGAGDDFVQGGARCMAATATIRWANSKARLVPPRAAISRVSCLAMRATTPSPTRARPTAGPAMTPSTIRSMPTAATATTRSRAGPTLAPLQTAAPATTTSRGSTTRLAALATTWCLDTTSPMAETVTTSCPDTGFCMAAMATTV